MQLNDINGEVRISLDTLHTLIEATKEAEETTKLKKEAIQMMGDFLQFLKTKDYFKDIQDEFNNSHNRVSIGIENESGRAVLYIDGNKP